MSTGLLVQGARQSQEGPATPIGARRTHTRVGATALPAVLKERLAAAVQLFCTTEDGGLQLLHVRLKVRGLQWEGAGGGGAGLPVVARSHAMWHVHSNGCSLQLTTAGALPTALRQPLCLGN